MSPGSWCLLWWFLCSHSSISFPSPRLSSVTQFICSFIYLSHTQKSHKTGCTLSAKGPSSCSPDSECPKSHGKHGKNNSLSTEKAQEDFFFPPALHRSVIFIPETSRDALCVPEAFDRFIFQELSIYSMSSTKLLASITSQDSLTTVWIKNHLLLFLLISPCGLLSSPWRKWNN